MIRFTCEQCGKKLKAGPEQAGSRYKCTRCGAAGRVPRWTDEVRGEDAQRANRVAAAAWQATAHESGEPPISFRKEKEPEQDMDMTPMVDVTFLLLIFFMITAAFSLQKALDVPTPDNPDAVAPQRTLEELEEDDDYVIVNVDQDSVVWVEDREAPTRHELIARLREKMEAGPKAPKNLLVSAHPDAVYKKVVMCLDVGAILGIANTKLATDTEGL